MEGYMVEKERKKWLKPGTYLKIIQYHYQQAHLIIALYIHAYSGVSFYMYTVIWYVSWDLLATSRD